LLRTVEATVDRIEPLPWTYQNQHKMITSRFALAWIGRRALLLRTDPEIPPGPTFVGMLQGLPHPEREWVRDSNQVSAVAYPAELDVTKPLQRRSSCVSWSQADPRDVETLSQCSAVFCDARRGDIATVAEQRRCEAGAARRRTRAVVRRAVVEGRDSQPGHTAVPRGYRNRRRGVQPTLR
jgi:hypothetical protein